MRKFQVLDFSVGSDHCPIILDIDLKQEKQKDTTDNGVTDRLPSVPWNERTKMLFLNRIATEEIQNSLKEVESLIDNSTENIDSVVEKLTDIFTIPQTTTKKSKKSRPPQKMWYDKSCAEVTKNYILQ